MDETVAESSRQTGTGAAAIAANADTKATSVKLLIKSSNQQYEDQTIECDMLWSIKRLKTHLQNTHPSKPPEAEQKLIYSGQLLNEKLLLKEVLRSYKDVYTHNHIIHLVYTPKADTLRPLSKSKPQETNSTNSNMTNATTTAATSSATLRQRPVAAQQNQQQQQQATQQQPQFGNFGTQFMPQMATGSAACPPYYGQNFMPLNLQMMATQQNVMQQWMQQVYTQYMDQYARFSSANAVNDNNATTANATATTTGAVPGMTWPGNAFLPFMSSYPGNMPYPVIPPPTFLAATPTNVAPPVANEQNTAAAPEAAENVENERAQAAPAAEPRFPLLAAEEVENHDWLDSFFAITRLAIFLTIMYFNSSPLRCLAVLLIGSFIYLYHTGVLRFNRERNNNNINRNNNAEAAAAPPAAAAQVEQPQANEEEETSNDDSEETDTADESNEATSAANPSTSAAAAAQPLITTSSNDSSFLSTMQTFVITFFTSLLPENPAVN